VQLLSFLILLSVSECLYDGVFDALPRTAIDRSVTGCHSRT